MNERKVQQQQQQQQQPRRNNSSIIIIIIIIRIADERKTTKLTGLYIQSTRYEIRKFHTCSFFYFFLLHLLFQNTRCMCVCLCVCVCVYIWRTIMRYTVLFKNGGHMRINFIRQPIVKDDNRPSGRDIAILAQTLSAQNNHHISFNIIGH